MGAGHSHTPAEADAGRMIPRMIAAAGILATFFVVELVTALVINSIALLADAGHMLTDVVAVFMGLGAVVLAKRGSTSPSRTYGWHRAEVFTAVANAVLLVGVAAFILYESSGCSRRRASPASRWWWSRSPAWWRTSRWRCCCARTPTAVWPSRAPTWRWSRTPSAASAC
jgi:hypothetical protein